MNTQLLISPRQSNTQASIKKDMEFLQSCIKEKKYGQGIAKARECLEREPHNLQSKKYLAFCLGMSGELYEAKSYWLELIEEDPYSEEYLLNLSQVEQN